MTGNPEEPDAAVLSYATVLQAGIDALVSKNGHLFADEVRAVEEMLRLVNVGLVLIDSDGAKPYIVRR